LIVIAFGLNVIEFRLNAIKFEVGRSVFLGFARHILSQ